MLFSERIKMLYQMGIFPLILEQIAKQQLKIVVFQLLTFKAMKHFLVATSDVSTFVASSNFFLVA